jgi:hypothetical protein
MRTSEDPTRDPASEQRDDHASEPRATPETDAFYERLYHPDTPDEMVEGASGQERRMMQRLERQRDEWHGAFLLATKRAGDAGELLVELKRQRDELLEALEELLTASFRVPSHPVTSNQELRRMDIACRTAEATIAAVKGGKP